MDKGFMCHRGKQLLLVQSFFRNEKAIPHLLKTEPSYVQ